MSGDGERYCFCKTTPALKSVGGDIPERGVLVGVVGGGPPGYHHHLPQAIIGDTFWDHFGVVFGTFGSFWAFLRSVFLGSF